MPMYLENAELIRYLRKKEGKIEIPDVGSYRAECSEYEVEADNPREAGEKMTAKMNDLCRGLDSYVVVKCDEASEWQPGSAWQDGVLRCFCEVVDLKEL